MNPLASVHGRRALAALVSIGAPIVLVVGFGHPGVHAARNVLVPGAGLLDEHLVLGLLFVAAAVVATVAWLRWGADWLLLATIGAAMVVSFVLAPNDGHPAVTATAATSAAAQRAAHEFPLVLLVAGALSWLRVVLGRIPILRRLTARRHRRRNGLGDLATLPPIDRCRAAAIVALAASIDRLAPDDVAAARGAVGLPDVELRARRVGAIARLRFRGDPLRRDHAAVRAALTLLHQRALDPDDDRSVLGVPCSEPGWVRPLDGTLSALAAAGAGDEAAVVAWQRSLGHEFFLRRNRRGGRRAGWWWTPLGFGGGTAAPWEHATFSGLARAAGWIGDDDWAALRAASFGAAARGVEHAHDERLIAAARLWLAFVDDPQADKILARPGVRRDPLACALDTLAAGLRHRPDALRLTLGTPAVPAPEPAKVAAR